ncbi:MAG: DUF6056 family protein [Turicibacter sp.]
MTKFVQQLKKYDYLMIAGFLFVFFAWVSNITPIVGDDWGYYNNGLRGPLKMSIEFYQTWSGRFIGEFLGFALATNKLVWATLFNPLVFAITYILMYKIIAPKKEKSLLTSLLLLCFMFTVTHGIRMETFTFVVGSINYRFSAMMALVQLYIIGKYLKEDSPQIYKHEVVGSILSGLIVGLIIENMAGGLILANLLLIGYRYIKFRKIDLLLVMNTLSTTIAFFMMRLSPGSQARVALETEWIAKSFFEKIATKYPEFIHYTFTENRLLIMGLVLIITILIYQKRDAFKSKYIPILLGISMLSGLVIINADIMVALNEKFGISFWKFTSVMYYFNDMNHILTLAYWTLMALAMFGILIFTLLNKRSVLMVAFYYMIAMAVMGAMMLSPIIGPRCAIFTVYFLIIVCLIVVNELTITMHLNKILVIIFSLFSIYIFTDFTTRYLSVHNVTKEQERLIEEYKENPTGELWLPAYPNRTIHSGEALAQYHQGEFKKYYKLPDDVVIQYHWK